MAATTTSSSKGPSEDVVILIKTPGGNPIKTPHGRAFIRSRHFPMTHPTVPSLRFSTGKATPVHDLGNDVWIQMQLDAGYLVEVSNDEALALG